MTNDNAQRTAKTPESLQETVTWLHLSDWHQGATDSFNRSLLLGRMMEDIDRRVQLNPKLAQIDTVIFSGDIAFSGKQDEYDTTEQDLIAPLREMLGPQTSFIFAPGNHDIDRTQIPRIPAEWEQAIDVSNRAKGDEVGEILRDPLRLPSLLAPFSNFHRFANRNNGSPNAPASLIRSLSLANGKVRIATINTAICCDRHSIASARGGGGKSVPSDYGALSISEFQIREAIKEVKHKGVRVRILVMHHPISWMHETEQPILEQLIAQNFDLVLYGHEHLPRFSSVSGNFGDVKFIPAGCSYAGRNPSDPRYTNAFNFGLLHLDGEYGAIHHRVWQNGGDEWEADKRHWPDGIARFLIQNDVLPENKRFIFDAHRKYKPFHAKRPAKYAEITLIHRPKEIDGEKFLEAEIEYKLELHPGKDEKFSFRTTANRRISNHASDAVRAQAFVVVKMMPEPDDKQDISGTQVKIAGSVKLSGPQKTQILYQYRLLETEFGVWNFNLGRFTDEVRFRIIKAPGYEYEFLPLGGFPDLTPDPHIMGYHGLESDGGHLPGQGYMVQWYPK